MYVQNNNSNPYQTGMPQMYSQPSYSTLPMQNNQMYQIPGQSPTGQPGQASDPLSAITNIVGQLTQLIQTALQMIAGLVSTLTSMISGGGASAAGGQSAAGAQSASPASAASIMNPEATGSTTAPKSEKESGGTDWFKTIAKYAGELFGGSSKGGSEGGSSSWLSQIGSWIGSFF